MSFTHVILPRASRKPGLGTMKLEFPTTGSRMTADMTLKGGVSISYVAAFGMLGGREGKSGNPTACLDKKLFSMAMVAALELDFLTSSECTCQVSAVHASVPD
ncbi:hypothetical protein Nepgr_002967 [Nepenthes gracilis]|uniref:Uncharacterized protein n=1 Tax=Nepenthes gracilis TaxID=150966 RepID=A0AAD3RYN1_NEPGR|nr:hypothetical protein Nepgr_002967 [Nepenthes gracilis]